MIERAYTVAEIDALRRACLFYVGWPRDDAQVERLVRTYMLAGLTAQDVEEESLRQMRKYPRPSRNFDALEDKD